MNTPHAGSELYDVLILGCGPVGATLACLLGKCGHRVAVAEMHPEVYDKPRAINLDQEALRLWQRIDIAHNVARECEPHPGTDFIGADGELIKAIYSAPPPYPMGWPANVMFVQPEAEQQLRTRIGGLDSVDLFLEYMAEKIVSVGNSVSVTCKTPEGIQSLTARYLVGCDGANSRTRQWINSSLTDLGFSEHYVVVDAWVTKDTPLPPRTTQYCNPDAPTSYIVCSGNLRRWELKILPDENIADYDDLNHIKKRLAPFVDIEALKFWRSAVYHFNARLADTWYHDKVFLAGDAAHTMPPFLGQGLNSGLRDAANLAWKLSYVLLGKASAELLHTYQSERRPHIFTLTQITKELGQIVGETDPIKAAERDTRLRQDMRISGPVTVRQELIPPLASGFLDKHGGELAGTMFPQPTVRKENSTYLLDDLLSGFSMIQLKRNNQTLSVTTDVETDSPHTFSCNDTEGLLADLLGTQSSNTIIVRPDGIIWSAAKTGIARLSSALGQPMAAHHA